VAIGGVAAAGAVIIELSVVVVVSLFWSPQDARANMAIMAGASMCFFMMILFWF
jgi:hypothetical protein